MVRRTLEQPRAVDREELKQLTIRGFLLPSVRTGVKRKQFALEYAAARVPRVDRGKLGGARKGAQRVAGGTGVATGAPRP